MYVGDRSRETGSVDVQGAATNDVLRTAGTMDCGKPRGTANRVVCCGGYLEEEAKGGSSLSDRIPMRFAYSAGGDCDEKHLNDSTAYGNDIWRYCCKPFT